MEKLNCPESFEKEFISIRSNLKPGLVKKILFVMALFCLFAARPLQAQVPAPLSSRLQTIMDSACKAYNIKGASASVYIPDMGIWKGAYGESHAGTPITTDMYFGIGSNTKTYISALMLKLQEQGLLKLSDTIGTWIHNQPYISGKITIRQLLSHTSGLNNFTDNQSFDDTLSLGFLDGGASFRRTWTPADILKMVGKPDFAPGKGWAYSNTNYIIAGLIIEQVLGKPIQVALHELVLDPQGLTHTVFYPAENPSDAVPHVWSIGATGTELDDLEEDYNYSNKCFYSLAWSAGAIMATAEDNVMFWSRLTSGKIISKDSWKQMCQYTRLNFTSSYGLGIFRYTNINGHKVYEHGGTCFGFIAENLADSVNGIAVSVLTNQDSVSNNILLNRVVAALHKASMEAATAGIPEAQPERTDNEISLYPNPATDYIRIHAANMQDGAEVWVYDMTGKTIMQKHLTAQDEMIDIAGLPSGIYTARLILGGVPSDPRMHKFNVIKAK